MAQPLKHEPLVDAEKRISELLSALHHTRRPDATAVLRTGLGVRLAVATGHPAAARSLRKASPAALLASWVTALATAPLDTIQLDFRSLSDPAVVHAWARERPALTPLSALRAHGQAMDPEFARFCTEAGAAVVGGPAPAQLCAANEQLHQDAQLCLFALAQLWNREDRPVEVDADASDSRQVHAALTTLAYKLAQFSGERWGEAVATFVTSGWDGMLVDSLCQADAPEHFAACAQVLRQFRTEALTGAGTGAVLADAAPTPVAGAKRPRDEVKTEEQG